MLLSEKINNLLFSTGTFEESGITTTPLAKVLEETDLPDWICENTLYTSYKLLLTDKRGRRLFLFTK